jgi:PAS domain S-box-containing protein
VVDAADLTPTTPRGDAGRVGNARAANGRDGGRLDSASGGPESNLAQMEGRYRGLLEAAPDALVVVNGAGEIVLLNLQAEKQFGYHRDELVGQQVTNIIPKGFAERLIADDLGSAAEALAQQIGTGIELVALRKDGTDFPIEIMLSPLESPEGILVTAAIRDISVRKAAESHLAAVMVFRDVSASRALAAQMRVVDEELGRSNRELQDFATIASHDLQEPLRKIQAFADRLEESLSSVLDEEAAGYLRRMKDAAARMQTLINDLLAYSQVGLRPDPPQPVDLGRVVSDVLLDLDERIRTTKGKVHVGPLPTLLASPLQMRQLFQNLIANALKFHPEGVAPEVRVEAAARSSTRLAGHAPVWEIRVRDNGIGFEEEYAEKIFAPFQRLNGRHEFEGTGMGLAICRKIVVQCGGAITATSHPGAGATFVITLPRTAAGVDAVASAG